MGRRTRWVVGLLGLGSVLAGVRLAGSDVTALFPGALFTFIAPSGLIRASDFNPVAKEVEAIEARLGVLLGNIPSVYAPCARIEGPVAGETIESVWTAPVAGHLTQVTCDASGVNSLALFDLSIVTAGVPASAGLPSASCGTNTATYTPANGAMAAGDRLDIVMGNLVGSVPRVTICVVFQPGA